MGDNTCLQQYRFRKHIAPLHEKSDKADKNVTVSSGDKTASTYDEVIALFDGAQPQKATFSGIASYYISIPLVFSDGSRNYKECLHFETEESGDTLHQYGNAKNGYKSHFIPLTGERKFELIMSKISGSGNKKVIYSMLKDLMPKEHAPEKPQNAAESIAGESVEIIMNVDLMRLQLVFDGIPSQETRSILKSNGFRWSPNQKAWQRLLNENAESALKRILD